jgi:mycoredoxin-dependent peroxiredoxin
MHPRIGAPAPDFELSSQYGERIRLSELRGRPVALVFFPLAFSGTCTSELGDLRDNVGLFSSAGVDLIGISVDSKACLRAWGEQERSDFPLLADFWPHGEVARRYGVFLEDRGYAARGTFLVDAAGTIRDCFLSGPGEARPLARYRAALAAIA